MEPLTLALAYASGAASGAFAALAVLAYRVTARTQDGPRR